jgi:hypothetical protein
MNEIRLANNAIVSSVSGRHSSETDLTNVEIVLDELESTFEDWDGLRDRTRVGLWMLLGKIYGALFRQRRNER